MHRIKGVVEPLILLAPLAVVGKGGGKAQDGIKLFYNGEITQGRAVDGLFVKEIEQIGHDDGVVIVIQAEEHGHGTHDRHHDDGRSVPKGRGLFRQPPLELIHDPNGDERQSESEHHIVPVVIEELPGGKEIEGHFRHNGEEQEIHEILFPGAGLEKALHEKIHKQRKSDSPQNAQKIAYMEQRPLPVQIRRNQGVVYMVQKHGQKGNVF